MPIKMYAIFARETLVKMDKSEGKLAAQAGHAYLHAWWDAEDRWNYLDVPSNELESLCPYSQTMYHYRNGDDARKIALVVDSVAMLKILYDMYKPHMGATLVEDCGYTIFTEPTITAVGLGPIDDTWFETGPTMLKELPTLRSELRKK